VAHNTPVNLVANEGFFEPTRLAVVRFRLPPAQEATFRGILNRSKVGPLNGTKVGYRSSEGIGNEFHENFMETACLSDSEYTRFHVKFHSNSIL
jgi:hypothetical protein